MKYKTDQNNGTDVFDRDKRSDIMSRVKSKNTKPEIFVRKALHKKGYRFRLHKKNLAGSPDLVLAKYETAIFIHGCFWHQHPGCKKSTYPKQNAEFWKNKLDKNVERDARARTELENQGWKVIVVWECSLKRNPEEVMDNIEKILLRKNKTRNDNEK